ncbi:cytochrome ubiquinol oxidase subunit I [Streptomyces spiralis]
MLPGSAPVQARERTDPSTPRHCAASGLNRGRYARAVGPILGVTIGMEVITAFLLEAGFIGIMPCCSTLSGEAGVPGLLQVYSPLW